jgi:hypothetical protein
MCRRMIRWQKFGWKAEVRLEEGESRDGASPRFRCKMKGEELIKEVKRHSF